MAFTTTISRSYSWRMIIMGVLCIGFAVWGAYDLLYTIPHKTEVSRRYTEIEAQKKQLEDNVAHNIPIDVTKYEQLKAELNEISPDGKVPQPPGAWDSATQWLFISCILFAPTSFWAVIKTRRRKYELDDDGTLHMPEGVWRKDQIADIDMSRWMAKSIAYVVHTDGTRVMLDDYKHKGLHLIIGAIATEKYPDVWTAEAKPRKPEPEEPPPLPSEEEMEAQEHTPQA